MLRIVSIMMIVFCSVILFIWYLSTRLMGVYPYEFYEYGTKCDFDNGINNRFINLK